MSYHVDEKGFYGEFGGAYIPEILYATVHDLQQQYEGILESEAFKLEYHQLLKDFRDPDRALDELFKALS